MRVRVIASVMVRIRRCQTEANIETKVKKEWRLIVGAFCAHK